MKVVGGTSKIHADTFAIALGAEVVEAPAPGDDWIFLVGVDPSFRDRVISWRQNGIKVAGYWIGSDSLCAIQDENYRSRIPEFDVHFCVHERIQRELAEWKVDAKVLYPCARTPSTGLPPPTEKMVGVYMPEPNLYMLKETLEVVNENPELKFGFYGMGFDYDLPPNVENIGRRTPEEIGKFSDQMSVLLRLCKHDGNPVGGIELKQRDRHVVENYPYSGFLYAETLDDVSRFLGDPKTHEGDYSPWGAFYREKCSRESFAATVKSVCQ
jgi:hypothetical protein